MPEQHQIFIAQRQQIDHDEGARKQRRAEEKIVGKRQQQRNEPAPFLCLQAVQKNHRDRTLQHLETERTEKQHRDEQHPADQLSVVEQRLQLRQNRTALTRHRKFQSLAYRCQQHLLVDHIRQHDHHQDKQRHDGEQRVISHRTRQQQTLIRLKRSQHLHRKGEGVPDDMGCAGVDKFHDWSGLTD